MDERITALQTLQGIDLQIRELELASAAYPVRVKEIDDDLGADRAESDARQAELDELDKQRRAIEGQIQIQKDQARKWEGRLGSIKTPREYAALSREIDIAKKGMKNQEDEILNILEQAEALKNEIERIERRILEKEQGYEEERRELGAKLESLAGERAELEDRRRNAAEGIDRGLLANYDRIRSRRAGVALAQALPNMTCGACRMRIPPQLYNEIVTGKAGVAQCPACNRILFTVVDDTEEERNEEAAGS